MKYINLCIEEPNSERVFDRIFAEIAGFVWFVSLGLLKIVFGVSRLAVQMGAFIGIVVDSRQSALLHGNIRAQCFLMTDRLREPVVAFQDIFNSIHSCFSLLSCMSRRIDKDVDDGVRVERSCNWWRST